MLVLLTSLIYVQHILVRLLLFFPISQLRKRKIFEQKNQTDEIAQSFSCQGLTAFRAYHLSSEGEWEQIRSEVMKLLTGELLIEIIYTSPSVEKTLSELARKNARFLRVLRMPILRLTDLDQWITAKELTLVRYDFFPELLIQKWRGKKLHLLWASLKGKNGLSLFFTLLIYRCFDSITPATKSDTFELRRWFKGLLILNEKDGRVDSISERLLTRSKTLEIKFTGYENFLEYLSFYPRKIIFGSAYQEEIQALLTPKVLKLIKEKNILMVIVPHKLETSWKGFLENHSEQKVIEVNSESQDLFHETQDSLPPIVLIQLKGILCELYADFSFAYVGGGWMKSIHSVLEPGLAGLHVAVGPRVHRSTEVINLNELTPNKLHVMNHYDDFLNLLTNTEIFYETN